MPKGFFIVRPEEIVCCANFVKQKITKIEKDPDCIQTHNVSNNIYTSRNNSPHNDISRLKNTVSARRDVDVYQGESRNNTMSKNKSQSSSIEIISSKRSKRRTKTINNEIVCEKVVEQHQLVQKTDDIKDGVVGKKRFVTASS